MKSYRITYQMKVKFYEPCKGSFILKDQASSAEAWHAAFNRITTAFPNLAEGTPEGLVMKVTPCPSEMTDEQQCAFNALVACHAWPAVALLALSEGGKSGLLMAVALGFIVWGMIKFIQSIPEGGFSDVDDAMADFLKGRKGEAAAESEERPMRKKGGADS
jgi:hypothetical protein